MHPVCRTDAPRALLLTGSFGLARAGPAELPGWSAAEVHEVSVDCLGLDSSALDLTTVEAMASSLRRAAGFLCPCSGRTLLRAVVEPLRDLVDDFETLRNACDEVLEALVGHGDLLEFPIPDSEEARGGRF